MSRPAYTAYHPRWLRTPVSTYWWLGRRSYLLFILRELSSVFVAWLVVYLLMLLRALIGGVASYEAFLDWTRSPVVIVVNAIALAFVIFHAVTWFNLAPKALVVRLGGRPIPGVVIAASNYAAWAVVSAAVFWLLLME